jgi:hypothetical protein
MLPPPLEVIDRDVIGTLDPTGKLGDRGSWRTQGGRAN